MDIELEKYNIRFKYRVSGIAINNNKLLCVKINDNYFFCLPGGHVELNEDSKEAIIREFKEETDMNVSIKRLLYVTENFFYSKRVKCHELGLYYLLEFKDNVDLKDYIKKEQDGTLLELKWISINQLDKFKPDFLKQEIIKGLTNNIKHFVIKNDKIIQKES